MSVEAYPLSWPKGWPRENGKEQSKFKQPSAKAHALLVAEVSRMGGTAMVISSNVPLRQDGVMRMDREPVDPGVAVYFTRKEKQVVFACDRFDLLRDNMVSIAKTIEALRGIERWGASEMMERAFSGFKQLAADNTRPWWIVLDLFRATATPDQVDQSYRALLRKVHPDAGGSHEAMVELNLAKQQALEELS